MSSKAQLLYKIEGKNLEKPSFIYGTIHIMPEKDFIISESVKSALKSCNELAMEIDLNMDLKTQIEMIKLSMLPDGKTISDITTKENAERIRNFCIDSIKWKESKYNKTSRFKPFFLSSIITQELIGKSKSYEIEFKKLAKKNKMSMSGLETIQFQMNLMSEISDEEQIRMLLLGLSTDNSEFKKLLSAYLKKDINLLGSLMNDAEFSPEFYSNFIVKRNQKWIPVIAELIQKKSAFIAVGAAHLPGEEGVLHLLKESGYTITPVE
ncbi:MAG: TraB/GumN family protein [Sphingomonadales bacterium]